jgi:hypothetical protein
LFVPLNFSVIFIFNIILPLYNMPINVTHAPWSRVLFQKLIVTWFRSCLTFMEPKSPSLVPVLYHINPVNTVYPVSIRFIIILSFHLYLGLPSDSSLQVFVLKFCIYFSSLNLAVQPGYNIGDSGQAKHPLIHAEDH